MLPPDLACFFSSVLWSAVGGEAHLGGLDAGLIILGGSGGVVVSRHDDGWWLRVGWCVEWWLWKGGE
jgi:hypothetical protein